MLFCALLFLYMGAAYAFERQFSRDVAGWFFERKSETEKIKASVTLYNKIFTDLYVSNGVPLLLDRFPASKTLKHELYQTLGFLRGNKLILVYDMADLVFLDVKMTTPWTSEVIAFEEWNYLYQKAATRETARSIKGMGQGMKYSLVKQQGKWVIADYFPVDVTYDKPKDKFYY